jgi:hypothetical protein
MSKSLKRREIKVKKWFVVGLIVLSMGYLWGNSEATEIGTHLEFGGGYRVDNLNWNIAGDSNGNNPNILSELTWEDIDIFQLKAGIRSTIGEAFYVRGSLGYGWVFDGQNQDSDYSGDNRTLEWSRSNNATDNGNVVDATLGVGYQIKAAANRLKLIPIVGYSYSDQYFNITDGVQTVSEPALAPAGSTPLPLGPFSGLNSTYDSEWYGPWIGIDLLFDAGEKVTLFGGFEYHWANFNAEADWNLRSDFAHPKSFEHDADGTGIIMSLGGEYHLTKPWYLSLNINYQDWSTDPGLDRLFFSDGSTTETRLNEVNWDSLAIMLGLTYRFQYKYPNKPKWMP